MVTGAGEVACDRLVVAAGAWSTAEMARLGVALPVEVGALQMILTEPMAPVLLPVLGSAERKLSLKQIRTGQFLIGGGWPGDADLDSGTATPRPSSISGSIADAQAVFASLSSVAIERVWVGIEAQTPDAIPILGAVPGWDNLDVATGFSGHGFAPEPDRRAGDQRSDRRWRPVGRSLRVWPRSLCSGGRRGTPPEDRCRIAG